MIGICHLVYLQRWPEPKSEPESSRLDILLLVQTYENKNIIALKIHNSFFFAKWRLAFAELQEEAVNLEIKHIIPTMLSQEGYIITVCDISVKLTIRQTSLYCCFMICEIFEISVICYYGKVKGKEEKLVYNLHTSSYCHIIFEYLPGYSLIYSI